MSSRPLKIIAAAAKYQNLSSEKCVIATIQKIIDWIDI